MIKVLLDNVTATGASDRLLTTSSSRHTVQAIMGGTVVATAVTIQLQGSLNGDNWFELAEQAFTAAEITAGQAMFHVINKVVIWVRLDLTTLTGGTAPTITATYLSQDG